MMGLAGGRGLAPSDHSDTHQQIFEGHNKLDGFNQRGKSAAGIDAVNFLQNKRDIVKTELLQNENYNSQLITSR